MTKDKNLARQYQKKGKKHIKTYGKWKNYNKMHKKIEKR